MSVTYAGWRHYPARTVWHQPYINGELLTWTDFHSPQLDNVRDVHVLLPPSYRQDGSRHYPVIYMQDGQNLFDDRVSFGGNDWHVDDAMQLLAHEGKEAIVVALNHANERRVNEYNPFPQFWGGNGDAYIRFLRETVKPRVDADFRTLPDWANTGIMGSSMGGLISLYAFFAAPDLFGFVGAMSPAFWVGGGAIYETVERSPQRGGKIYLDNGTRENSARRMNALLVSLGYRRNHNLKYVVEKDAEHNEAAWARRLPDALRFLL